jgi:hypothetical protein
MTMLNHDELSGRKVLVHAANSVSAAVSSGVMADTRLKLWYKRRGFACFIRNP